jgi:hypothetical protein
VLLLDAEPKLLEADPAPKFELLPKPPVDADEPNVEAPLDALVVVPNPPFVVPPNPPPKPELAGPGGLLVAAICGKLPASIKSSSSIFGIIKSLYVC